MLKGMELVPDFKFWMGGQQEFVVGDKYMRKQRIRWGKPSIYLANEDPRGKISPNDVEWLNTNCIFAHNFNDILHFQFTMVVTNIWFFYAEIFKLQWRVNWIFLRWYNLSILKIKDL